MTDQEHADEIYSAVDALNRAISNARSARIITELSIESFATLGKEDCNLVMANVAKRLTEDKSKRA